MAGLLNDTTEEGLTSTIAGLLRMTDGDLADMVEVLVAMVEPGSPDRAEDMVALFTQILMALGGSVKATARARRRVIAALAVQALADDLGDIRDAEVVMYRGLGVEDAEYREARAATDGPLDLLRAVAANRGWDLPDFVQDV